MKTGLSLLALALCSIFPSAYAAAKIKSNKKTTVRVVQAAKADELISLFQPSSNRDYEGFSMKCDPSAAACELEVESEEENAGALIFGEAAGRLFNDLQTPVFESRTSDAKIYSEENGLLSIYCSRSLIANGDRYACSVELN